MTSAQQRRQRWVYLLSLVTALLIAAVGATLWLDSSKADKHTLKISDSTSMHWRRTDFDDIVFSRDTDQWQITSPCSLAVNSQRLDPLFNALQNQGERYDASSVDLLATGLQTPLAELQIDDQLLTIGSKDISGSYRYMQFGSTVSLIPEWVLSLINSGITGVANLSVFNDELTALSRSTSNNKTSAIVDSETLARDDLTNLSANQIVVWPIPDMPQVTGSVRLEAEYQDGLRETLELTMTNSFAAIRRDNSRCAYLLEPDAVPASIAP